MLKEEKQFEKEYGKDWIDKVNWNLISCFKSLSEKFIEKHADKVVWYEISFSQKLSEAFIEKYTDKMDWRGISYFQKLSEAFIEKHAGKVNWHGISCSQNLSEEFIERHAGKIDKELQLKKHHRKYDPVEEAKKYANKHNLTIKDGFLHVFRNHDEWNRGIYNKTIFYTKKNVEYRDWHCDLDPNEENSFGLGIWPKGNVEVKVKLKDFGCGVIDKDDGKARVWCFQLV